MFEVILVKNFSDDTIDRYCSESGIITISMSGSIGEFLSCAIERSKGNIIAFLDDDDEWEPQKLDNVIRAFTSDDDIGYFHNDYSYIDYSGKIFRFKRNVEGRRKNFRDFIFSFQNRDISKLFRFNADFNLSCIAVRRDIVSSFNNDLSKIRGSTDSFFFFLSLLSKVSVYVSSKKLTRYRVHTLNLSRSTDVARKEKEIKRQLFALYTLENLFSGNPVSGTESYKALEMLKTEYEMISIIFSSDRRLFLLKKLLLLISFPRSCSNPLRIRIIMFSLLYLTAGSFSQKVYQKILTI